MSYNISLIRKSQGFKNRVLVRPARNRSSRSVLHIISGFASPSRAEAHIEELKKKELEVSIDLIIGMTSHPEVQKYVDAFIKLEERTNRTGKINFSCRYAPISCPVHSKIYVWADEGGTAFRAFCGSVNYTYSGFFERRNEKNENEKQKNGKEQQEEAVCEVNPESAKKYFDSVEQTSERPVKEDQKQQ